MPVLAQPGQCCWLPPGSLLGSMPSPTIPLTCIKITQPQISMDTNILAIAIATVSSFVFVLAILLLLLYQREPRCCQFLCSCRFFQGPSQCDCPPPYFSNNQDLVGPPARSQPSERMRTRMQGHFQSDEIFCVGLPNNYQLPPWRPPHLPSYESVRKKDRQQQIHRLIAHRFGLWACRELPPTYEESLGPLPEVPPSSGSAHPFQRTTAFPTQRNTAV
ncbi:uncharacterized protein LOC114049304 [Vombatus ursinus]|uniref:uncharacterized protein LOC114049304 n=1 Tax=Vombatus ursinus TaxID=29139 RepID=UPI000FFCF5BB|nr:uncharacterized protein LOC114049304 [Vombatus ursinus]